MKSDSFVYNPLEVSKLGTDYIHYRHDHKEFAVDFPIQKMRSQVYPLAGGEVMSIIARPGNMKTSLMMAWARQRAEVLREGKMENRVSVYVTWEQSIEELHSFYVAAEQQISITKMAKGDLNDDDFKKIMDASAKRDSEPLFFIGHSTMRRTGRRPLTTDVLWSSLEEIQSSGFEVDSVYLDYLQRIPIDRSFQNPASAYSQIMDEVKNLALGLGLPVVVGVQASREVDSLKEQIPELSHGQWTSNVEQTSDRVLSLVKPSRYRKQGEYFGSHLVEGQNQLLVTVLKQKLGIGGYSSMTSFSPQFNRLNNNEIAIGGVDEKDLHTMQNR